MGNNTTDPSWNIVIHRSAERELANVTGSTADNLTNRLKQLRYYEEPTEPNYVSQIENRDRIFRVRCDDYRALCILNKPQIEVLCIGKRKRIYDSLDTAEKRAGIAD